MNLDAPYAELSPEAVLDALEVLEYRCDGRVLALNSYENRVYQIGIEDGEPVVAKFYRPGRWSDAAIAEEHAFAAELAAMEIPVVAPLAPRRPDSALSPGLSLRGFSAPGRALAGARHGRRARVGGALPRPNSRRRAQRRRFSIGCASASRSSAAGRAISCSRASGCRIISLTNTPISPMSCSRKSKRGRSAGAARARGASLGDCHRGNILWTDLGPHFVDLDDCVTGPAIQDLWMLLAGTQQEMRTQLTDLLKGYEQFLPFDRQRIGAHRAAARAAHDSLFGMAGAALVRPGISEGIPLVRRAALLGGALPGP